MRQKLALEAQYSPVFSITLINADQDGKQDLLLCGNITLYTNKIWPVFCQSRSAAFWAMAKVSWCLFSAATFLTGVFPRLACAHRINRRQSKQAQFWLTMLPIRLKLVVSVIKVKTENTILAFGTYSKISVGEY